MKNINLFVHSNTVNKPIMKFFMYQKQNIYKKTEPTKMYILIQSTRSAIIQIHKNESFTDKKNK